MTTEDSLPKWAHNLVDTTRLKILELDDKLGAYNQEVDEKNKTKILESIVPVFLAIEDFSVRFKFFIKANGIAETGVAIREQVSKRSDFGINVPIKPLSNIANILFIDTETTGLSKNDQSISVGAVLAEVDTKNGVILKEIARYYGLREPSCVISEGAYQVHGISDYQVKNKEFDLKELVTMFEIANLIVAHNAAFDKRMLSFMSDTQPNWGCSCWDIDWPDEIGGRSLDAISKYFILNRPVIHNSLTDTLVMIEALQQKKDDGSTYLLNLIRKHGL